MTFGSGVVSSAPAALTSAVVTGVSVLEPAGPGVPSLRNTTNDMIAKSNSANPAATDQAMDQATDEATGPRIFPMLRVYHSARLVT